VVLALAGKEFEKYRIIRDKLFENDVDKVIKELNVNS